MIIENLNSPVSVTEDDKRYAVVNAGFLANLLPEIPVYLVSSDLMDKIYPPDRKNLLDVECLRRRLIKGEENGSQFQENNNKNPNDERLINDCVSSNKIIDFPVVGLYVPKVEESLYQKVEKFKKLKKGGRVIFIATERICNWLEERKCDLAYSFRDLFTVIFIHELAHAFLDGNNIQKKSGGWKRFIEENMANAFVYRNFVSRGDDKLKFLFVNYTSELPIEYKAWYFLTLLMDGQFFSLALSWRDYKIYPFGTTDKDSCYPFMDIDVMHKEFRNLNCSDKEFEKFWFSVAKFLIYMVI